MLSRMLVLLAAATLMIGATSASAKEAGDWIIRAGATYIDPKSGNGTIDGDPPIGLDVDSATMLTFDGTYMITNNFGIELLAALPFKHDINARIQGESSKVATVKHLPPTLSAVYHFNAGKVEPYIGAGINWTIFFDEKEKGLLEDLDTSLSLGNSVGLAAVAGVDIALTERMYLNANVRWMDIDTDVKLAGVTVATAQVDPWVYSTTIGWKI